MGGKKGKIPHLFAKVTVLWCILCGTAASAWALRILSRTGHDASAMLGVILAFFGGELLILCMKTILKKENAPRMGAEGENHEKPYE